jgi:hypothetical protein
MNQHILYRNHFDAHKLYHFLFSCSSVSVTHPDLQIVAKDRKSLTYFETVV